MTQYCKVYEKYWLIYDVKQFSFLHCKIWIQVKSPHCQLTPVLLAPIESRIMPSRKADVNIWIFNEYRSNKPRGQSRKSWVQKHGDTEITQKDTIETTRTKQTNRTEYERHKK